MPLWRGTRPTPTRSSWNECDAPCAHLHPEQVFHESFGNISTLYVGLDCPLETLLERECGREDRWGGLARQSIDDHNGWSYDVRIDTSEIDPDEGADLVLQRLGRGSGG